METFVAKTAQTREAFDEYIYIISHDIRANVRALRELPQWIAEDLQSSDQTITPDIAENIELLVERADRLDRMMDDLLAYSRAGTVSAETKTNLSDALDLALEKIGSIQNFKLERHLPEISIAIPQDDLTTLFFALVHNAVVHHHNPTGTIFVSGEVSGSVLTLSVVDDGPGIRNEDRASAMKVMTGLNRQRKGSGMGLPICQKIAESYGGRLSLCTAQNGTGLRVSVTLTNPESAPDEFVSTFPKVLTEMSDKIYT